MKDQQKIGPGQLGTMDRYWYWEDNPFSRGEPYDRMQDAASAEAMTVTITIKRVSFDDGSVEEY